MRDNRVTNNGNQGKFPNMNNSKAPRTISFPHMGNYYAPIARLLRTVFPFDRVVPAPFMTRETIALGSRHSPDFVCSPFKHNMGCYIQALEAGADILIQTGLGCRFGYFGALQERLLRDLGYTFEFLCFSREKARPLAVYRMLKLHRSPLGPMRLLHAVCVAMLGIHALDVCESYIRQNLAYERSKGTFHAILSRFLEELQEANGISKVLLLRKRTIRALREVELNLPSRKLRVGIIGELYTAMDAFSNHEIERFLAGRGISVQRDMSVTFLIFGKRDKRTIKRTGGYLQYPVGANGIDSVAWLRDYAQRGFDGVIHVKSFGCTPELNAMPALTRLSRDMGIPLIHLSFDTQTSETGLETRLEAFCDMLEMRRNEEIKRGTGSGHRVDLNEGSRPRRAG